eukprot:TRINITY_DN4455_c0_g1_i2.p1 TRINITY_DN4455_c0_g1~~TRINITY_DN4455_c0_g1_i2.p1  ORF type:complete len:176 (-),score=15.40 TRINITY_DN4455_c0_g1_i2:108-635(-)
MRIISTDGELAILSFGKSPQGVIAIGAVNAVGIIAISTGMSVGVFSLSWGGAFGVFAAAQFGAVGVLLSLAQMCSMSGGLAVGQMFGFGMYCIGMLMMFPVDTSSEYDGTDLPGYERENYGAMINSWTSGIFAVFAFLVVTITVLMVQLGRESEETNQWYKYPTIWTFRDRKTHV